MGLKIGEDLFDAVWIFMKQANSCVAGRAKKATDSACAVTMVDSEPTVAWLPLADSAPSILMRQKCVIVFERQTMLFQPLLEIMALDSLTISLSVFGSVAGRTRYAARLETRSGIFGLVKRSHWLNRFALPTPFFTRLNGWPTANFSRMTENVSKWFSLYPTKIFSITCGQLGFLTTATAT